MNREQPRQPKGVPTGGRFAATQRSEADVTLDGGAQTRRGALEQLLEAYLSGGPLAVDVRVALPGLVPDVPDRVAGDLWQSAVIATVHADDAGRERALDQLETWQDREARWHRDPAFSHADPQVTVDQTTGPVQYTTVTGAKYTGYRDVALVAKDVRRDLKDAQRAGFLPDDVSFSVTTSKYTGGQSLRVEVRGMDDADIYELDPSSWNGGRRFSAPTSEIRQRVEAVARAYGRDTTDHQTDYYDVSYYCHVEVEDAHGRDWREREAAARRRRAA